tara:strand:+ start:36072 stop:38393 length:2322 start_codon:yes stop_codon:yes gene_type:complete
MKKPILFFFCLLISFSPIKGDEGMWLPILINKLKNVDLEKMGLQLSPEELYSVNNNSLKDAIVSFNGYCTGEIISDQGLLLTNHHCGYDAIQYHSSVDSDYLKNGFWAANKKSELINPDMFVDFLIKMEDVTSVVLAGTDTASNTEAKIQENISNIIKLSTEGTHYWSRVNSFYGGNEYYLFVYERFEDVRLVGAPPESIGKYGGDTDNWMWPRHTGDFALFRVYSGPDGMPAKYSSENIPLKPKHHLPISLNGVNEGDFSMIFGYPGSTDRYLSSFGIEQALNLYNPTVVKIRTGILDVLDKHMNSDAAIKIKYASKKASVANYWKYYQGQSKQLKDLNVFDQKVNIEEDFKKFTNSSKKNIAKYGEVLNDIDSAYKVMDEFILSVVCLNEGAWRGSDAMRFARTSTRGLLKALEGNDRDLILSEVEKLRKRTKEFFKDYDPKVDADLFLSTMNSYVEIAPKEQLPRALTENPDLKKWRNQIYNQSIFCSKQKMNRFLSSTINMKNRILEDPIFKAQESIIGNYLDNIMPGFRAAQSKLDDANKLFIAALMQMYPEKDFYSDANFTMRMTYGSVGGYVMNDGQVFNFKTNLDGVIKKMNNEDPEFIVPDKLVELYNKKDYGVYEENGSVPVCFISNNDITGGNSGSPVINGQGHLIGCAFDGNWEGMSGDIAFDSKLNRTISVDAKYILFIIDKFAGATHLINEMTLVKSAPKTKSEKKKKVSNNKKVEKKSNESFGDAFLKAWKKGLKTFYWNGELYTTQRADDPVLIETE